MLFIFLRFSHSMKVNWQFIVVVVLVLEWNGTISHIFTFENNEFDQDLNQVSVNKRGGGLAFLLQLFLFISFYLWMETWFSLHKTDWNNIRTIVLKLTLFIFFPMSSAFRINSFIIQLNYFDIYVSRAM